MSGRTDNSVRRPKTVKVLVQTYKIMWFNEDQWYAHHLGQDDAGITQRDSGEIWLRADPTSDEDSLRMTLMHEVLHCCTQATRLDKYLKEVEDPEEFIVGQVSPVLLQVMNDNPGLMAYLLRVKK
jgi:hypothetical protein